MATADEVKAKRAEVEGLREQVRAARSAAVEQARSGENDVRMASLTHEEEMLKQELARLGGTAPQASPAPAPSADTTSKANTPKGDTSRQEG